MPITNPATYAATIAKRRTTVVNRQPSKPKPEALQKRQEVSVLAVIDALMRTRAGSVEAQRVLEIGGCRS